MNDVWEAGWLDIGMLVFMALSLVVGLMRGFVFELLSLAGWFVAFFTARECVPFVQPYVTLIPPGSVLNYGVTFACVFLVIGIVWGLAARLVRSLIRATPLSPVDRLLGAAFGLVRGLAVLLVAAALIGVSPWSAAPAVQTSRGAGWLKAALTELRPWFTGELTQRPSA